MNYDGNLALLLGCWFALVALAAWEFVSFTDDAKTKRQEEWKKKQLEKPTDEHEDNDG